MKIPILVEPKAGGGFQATCGAPFDITADGDTTLEAIQRVEEQLQARRRKGAQLFWTDVAETPAIAKYAGMLKDDELTREYLETVEEYRA